MHKRPAVGSPGDTDGDRKSSSRSRIESSGNWKADMMASLLPLLSPWAEQLVVKVRANLVADLQRDCRKLLVATTSIETFVYYAYIYIYIYILWFFCPS